MAGLSESSHGSFDFLYMVGFLVNLYGGEGDSCRTCCGTVVRTLGNCYRAHCAFWIGSKEGSSYTAGDSDSASVAIIGDRSHRAGVSTSVNLKLVADLLAGEVIVVKDDFLAMTIVGNGGFDGSGGLFRTASY